MAYQDPDPTGLAAGGKMLEIDSRFTHLWKARGWLSVAVAIDLLARRIVGWLSNAR